MGNNNYYNTMTQDEQDAFDGKYDKKYEEPEEPETLIKYRSPKFIIEEAHTLPKMSDVAVNERENGQKGFLRRLLGF
ncbi:MAG: hypothetical protein WC781_04050 [Candidatus Pacearchaeota archaeon]|jgi:hypothetical protein